MATKTMSSGGVGSECWLCLPPPKSVRFQKQALFRTDLPLSTVQKKKKTKDYKENPRKEKRTQNDCKGKRVMKGYKLILLSFFSSFFFFSVLCVLASGFVCLLFLLCSQDSFFSFFYCVEVFVREDLSSLCFESLKNRAFFFLSFF